MPGKSGIEERSVSLPVGVIIRRSPGVTRWARWVWRAVAVLPGAADADWKEMRREGDTVEFHAATMAMELHRSETEGYLVSLNMAEPTVFVILRKDDEGDAPHDWIVHAVTASAYEAQDYQDSGEEIVEPVPMPPSLAGWVQDFCDRHHEEEAFVKRKRDKRRVDEVQDGVGDARIRQTVDVYRAPAQIKPAHIKPTQTKRRLQ